jgi:hypothetical protein
VVVTPLVVRGTTEAVADRLEAPRRVECDTTPRATPPVCAVLAVGAGRLIARPIATNANTLNTAVSLRAREAACRL